MRWEKTQIRERGAVLLSTLLLMAVMAALSVTILEDIRHGIKREANIEASEQLDWYMLGGEEFVVDLLTTTGPNLQIRLGEMIRQNQPIEYPLEDGIIRISLSDAQNCYNLNRLANAKTSRNERLNLINILRAAEIDPQKAQSLVAVIQDWIDADTIPLRGGAENLTYSEIQPAYQTPGTRFLDITELRALKDVSEEDYQNLRRIVCVLPIMKSGPYNVNTMDFEDFSLLADIFGPKHAEAITGEIIGSRPQGGYKTTQDIFALPSVRALNLKGAGRNKLTTTTDMVWVSIEIEYKGLWARQNLLVNLNGQHGVKVISRRKNI